MSELSFPQTVQIFRVWCDGDEATWLSWDEGCLSGDSVLWNSLVVRETTANFHLGMVARDQTSVGSHVKLNIKK